MRIVWSWLLDLIELKDQLSPERGADLLTRAGLEVEAMENLGDGIRSVVVAEVAAKRPHPKAGRFTIVDVLDSRGSTTTQVVCGAANVPEPGGNVVWARPGAKLPNGMTLGTRPLKGVESHGMLCSASELGLEDDSEGIFVFDESDQVTLGQLVTEAMALKQVVFDIASPANRGDVLGHRGVARELAALAGGKLLDYEHKVAQELTAAIDPSAEVDGIDVVIEDPKACPRYVARQIIDLTVGPSPMWMQSRLRAVGVRPISNLVDVTNYVMFELGQPLHAFDRRDIVGQSVIVRHAKAGESIVTLDDVKRDLTSADLLICDKQNPVALAGVMGGKNSQVCDSTKHIVLESAAFLPIGVRRTAKRLGLHSESSHRFERGVDPNGVALASARAATLIADIAGGRVARQAVDQYPVPLGPRTVSLRSHRVRDITGVDIGQERIGSVLTSLGLGVAHDGAVVQVTCPTFRADLTREVDLIEEVIRIDGFDKVPATLPRGSMSPLDATYLATAPASQMEPDPRPGLIRDVLIGMGLSEAITFGFMSTARLMKMGLPEHDPRNNPLRIRNPMSEDQSVMRTMLLPNLLSAVARNRSFGIEKISLFEIGSVFLPSTREILPNEPTFVAGVLAGQRAGWLGDSPPVDVFDVKACVERVLTEIAGVRAKEAGFTACSDIPYLHPGVSAKVRLAGTQLGEFGEIHPDVREAFEIDTACFAFVLSVNALPALQVAQMRAIPKHPAICRDISIFVDEDIPAARIHETIVSAKQPLIEQIRVLEDYRDPTKVAKGKKGMLWSITYRAGERTLRDVEVDAVHEQIVNRLIAQVAAEPR